MSFYLVLHFCYPSGKSAQLDPFKDLINHKTIPIHLNQQGHSEPISLEAFQFPIICHIDHLEMIDLNTGYPTHQQIITITASTTLQPITLLITVLPPPIVIDLNPKQPTLLNTKQLRYFKEHGNNAVLFIHGYNLSLGEYGCYPNNYQIQQNNAISEHHLKDFNESSKNLSLEFTKSLYTRTIACNFAIPDEIINRFPALFLYYQSRFAHISHHPAYNPEGLGKNDAFFNGTEAKHWFIHMEHNFNRAAGFDNKNYQPYTRTLNVHWPSGNGMTEFMTAEKMAEQSAVYFFNLLQQLIAEEIQISIVAHSLGCRVVLQALQILATQNPSLSHLTPINQVVLWQAAIPNTALDNDAIFGRAHQNTKKIILLYSKKDTVLQTLYSTAKVNRLSFQKALGYCGPRLSPSILVLQKSGKLVCVDQTKLLLGHSFMKVPTNELMRDIYQEYIIGGQQGIQHFGNYQFS